MLRPLTASALAAAVLLSACGRDDETSGRDDGASTGPAPATTAAPPAQGCRPVAQPEPREEPDLDAPRRRLDASQAWTVVLRTNCGTLRIRLAVDDNPKTAASFAHLVRRDFYDGLTFHRIGRTPDGADFVVQAGDPLGEGSGGPGYSVVEPPPGEQTYERGVVAMAKTAIEDPGTSGSQFFIVTAPDAALPPEYAVAGEVTGDDAALDRIAAVEADPQTERPESPVVIEDAELVRGDGS